MKNFRKPLTGLMALLLGLSVMGFLGCEVIRYRDPPLGPPMTPGTFTVEADGYYYGADGNPITYYIHVTVSEHTIVDITTTGDLHAAHSGNLGVWAIPVLRERVLQHPLFTGF